MLGDKRGCTIALRSVQRDALNQFIRLGCVEWIVHSRQKKGKSEDLPKAQHTNEREQHLTQVRFILSMNDARIYLAIKNNDMP